MPGLRNPLLADLNARPADVSGMEEKVAPSDEESGRGWFDRFATQVDLWVSRPVFFVASVIAVICWAIWGPFAGFSSVWQLVINTATTILTFLLVGLAANSGARDTKAIQLKLNAIAEAIACDMEDGDDAEARAKAVRELREGVGLEHHTSS